MALRLNPAELDDEESAPEPQPQAAPEDDQGGDVLDAIAPAPRRQIDTSRGNPLAFTGDLARWFAPEVKQAQQAQAHNDVLDRMEARSTATAQARAAARAARDAETARKTAESQAKKDTNSRVEADFRTRGVQMYTDAHGDIQPVVDEKGATMFHPKKGETEYDPATGEAFRQDRTESGKKEKVMLDAGAPIGPADGDLGNLYKQNAHTGWTHVGTVEEGLSSSDPEIKAAAQKAHDEAQKHQHAAAKEALTMEANAVAAQERDANIAYQQKAQNAAELQRQVDTLRANPAYNETEGGAFFGLGKKPAPGAQQLRDQEAKLTTQIGELTANPPDPKQFAPLHHAAATRAKAFDYLIGKNGSVEGAVDEWGRQLAGQGKDPAQDPVIQSVNKARERAGLPPLLGITPPAPEEPKTPTDPLDIERQQAHGELQAAVTERDSRIAPLRQRLDANKAQLDDLNAQAEQHGKTLKAIAPNGFDGLSPAQFDRLQPALAAYNGVQTQIKTLSEDSTAAAQEHDAILAEYAPKIGDEKQPGELLQRAKELDAQSEESAKQKKKEAVQAEIEAEAGDLATEYKRLGEQFESAKGDRLATDDERGAERKQMKVWEKFTAHPTIKAKMDEWNAAHPDATADEISKEAARLLDETAEAGSYGSGRKNQELLAKALDESTPADKADAAAREAGATKPVSELRAEAGKRKQDFERAYAVFKKLAENQPTTGRDAGYEQKLREASAELTKGGINPEMVREARKAGDQWFNRKKGFFDALKDAHDEKSYIGFVGSVKELGRVLDLKSAAERLESGTASDREITMLRNYLAEDQQPRSFLYNAVSTAVASAGFAQEFAATAGVGAIGEKAALVGAKKILEKLASKGARAWFEKQLARNVATKFIGEFAGKAALRTAGAIAQFPIAAAGRIAAGTIERTMPELALKPDEAGHLAVVIEGGSSQGKAGQSLGEALSNAIPDQFVEVWSEKAGGALGMAGKALKTTAPGNRIMASAFMRAVAKLNPANRSQLFAKAAKATAWNGIIGEMFEERVGEVAKAVLNIDGQEYKAPTLEQLMTEAVAFAMPGPAIHAGAKVIDTATNLYKDKANIEATGQNEESRRLMSADVLENIGAITEPTPEGAALGAKPLAEQKAAIAEIDARMDGLKAQLDGKKGLLNVNRRAALMQELAQANDERAGIVQKGRALNEAAAEIEGIGTATHAGSSPEEIAATQNAARALVKISQGAEMDSLTAVERAAVEHKDSPDGLPRVEMVKGGDGAMHPVITDGAISRLRAVAPAAASLIGKTEAARRQEVLAKTKGTKAAEPAAQPQGTPSPAAGDQGSQSGASEVTPMRALSEDEDKRVRVLRRKLTNKGVSDELAERVARGYVSKHGAEGAPSDHDAGLAKALAAAGGHTFATEPDHAKRTAANKAALESHTRADAKASDAVGDVLHGKLADDFDAQLQRAGWGVDPKSGKVVVGKEFAKPEGMTDETRIKARTAIRNLAKNLAIYFGKMPVTTVVGPHPHTPVSEGQPSSGGVWMTHGGGITVSIHDVLQRHNIEELADPERAKLVVQEEAIHTLADNLLGREAVEALWNNVVKEAPKFAQLVAESYGEPVTKAYILGHELIRYRAQWLLNKKVSEEASPGVMQQVKQFLARLLAALRNFAKALKAEGATDETISSIENAAQHVAGQIREMLADARRVSPYGTAYEPTTAALGRSEGEGEGHPAQSGAVLQPGGVGVAADAGGSGGKGARAVRGSAGQGAAGAGGGGIQRSDADSAATRAELARVQGELDAIKLKQEQAKQRRDLAVSHVANRLADFTEILSHVPEDAKPQAEAILKQAIIGAPTHVIGVNHKRHPAAYMAAAPGLVQTSHLPGKDFAKNPAYGGENTRKYHNDPTEQQKVRNIALNIDAPAMVNTAMDASVGPPQIALVIDTDGKVALQTAGGNGREMGFNLADPPSQNQLADEWQAQAANYGFQNLPDGYRGYRFLGTYDLRNEAERKSYQNLVDALNPSPGVVSGAGQRAEIDARTKIDPAALQGLTLDLSTQQAVDKLNEFLRDADRLGLDRNLMNSIVSDAPNAQLYMQKLILAAAFHSPAVSTFYFDSQGISGGATAKGLIKAAATAGIALRTKDGDTVADAIAQTLAEVIDYTRQGQTIASAIGNAAQQLPTGPDGQIVQDIARALKDQVVFREQNKRGNVPVDSEASVENFTELFEDITRAVGNHDGSENLLGEKDSIADTLKRALAANARRRGEVPKSRTADDARAQAIRNGFTIQAYRGISKAAPFNQSGTSWWTTNRDVAETYAKETFGYDDADVIEGMVKPDGVPIHDIRKLSEDELNALEPDEFGNPQKVGIYRNSDDSLLGSNHPHTAIHVPIANVRIIPSEDAPRSRAATSTEATDARRMRQLQRQQREEGLNRWEQAELETLEKKAGQSFMGFFDETKREPDFSLDQQQTGGKPAEAEQLALLSRSTKKPADEPGGTPYGDNADARQPEQTAAAHGTGPQGAGAQELPGRAELQQGDGGVVERRGEQSRRDVAGRTGEGRGGVSPVGDGETPRARALDSRGRDPRVVKEFGDDWKYGWNALGVPNQPTPLHGEHPLLKHTNEKDFAQLPTGSKAVRLGLLPAGRHSRKELRAAIVAYFVRGGDGKLTNGQLADLRVADSPEIMLLAGGGGAGKSSMLAKLTGRGEFNPKNRALVNADEVREFLPEYDQLIHAKDVRASFITHEESSVIADEIFRKARQLGVNITYDGTLAKGAKWLKHIEHLQAEGYRVRMVAVTIDPHEAMQRAYLRAKHSGRYVPDATLLEAHQGFNASLPAYADTLGHEITIFDNSPEHAIAISYDEMKAGPARELTDQRAKLDPNAKDLDSLLASYGETREGATPMARAAKPDPNQLDIFGGNPLTPAPAPGKGKATKPSHESTGPRRNDEPPRRSDGDLELPGLFGDAGRPGKTAGLDQGQLDLAGGGNATGGSRGSGSGGTLGTEPGDGGKGAGALGATEEGAAGDNQGGISGDVRQGRGGDAADQPPRLERPAEGSPARNAKIDPTRSYAPRQGKARFDANLDAIRLMRRLEEEKRNATTAEKEQLLAYTGWGWMKEAFNKVRAEQWKARLEDQRARYDSAKQRYDDAEDWKRRSYGIRDPGTFEAWQRDQDANDRSTDDEKALISWAKNYLPSYERIRQELTPEEFDSAAKSVRNAHYTDVPVIGQIWNLVRRLGFKGGKATEPGAGIGHFIGAQPDDMAGRTVWNAVELDEVTARILSHLYPEANVNGEPTSPGRSVDGQGWQDARIPNNSQDLVISNVPFAKQGPGQSEKEFGAKFNLHNYFFARAFAKAKPGGLVVFITSNSTMDNNLDQRQALAGAADLVGAIRLPNNAFKANAGTEVTTDILVFRKPDGTKPNFDPQSWTFTREVNRVPMTSEKPDDKGRLEWLRGIDPNWIPQNPAIAEPYKEWTQAGTPETGQRVNALLAAMTEAGARDSITFDAPVIANEYWLAHPDHALGRHALESSMYNGNGEYSLEPTGEDLIAAMDRAINTFPQDVSGGTASAEPERLTASKSDKMGAYVERDGKIYRVDPDGLTQPDWIGTPKKVEMFRSWARIRAAYNTLIDLELNNGTDDDIESARAALNRAYDRHVTAFKPLAQPLRNPLNFLGDDPDFIPLQALEIVSDDVQPDGKLLYHYQKADIFTKRLLRTTQAPTSAGTLEDAVLMSMSKHGFLHVPTVAELLGISEPEAERKVVDSKLGFIDPATGMVESADAYLSGHVSKKLDAAIEAAKDDPKYRTNVDALTDAQPPWQSIAGIHPNLRASWVPAEVVHAFAGSVLKLEGVTVDKAAGFTTLQGHTTADTPDKFSTDRKSASTLLKEIVGNEATVVKDRVPNDNGKGYKQEINTDATNAAKAARAEIEQAFGEYLKTTSDRVTVRGEEQAVQDAAERAFNKSAGGWVPPTFRGEWITLPGQSGEIYLDRGFRKAVLARLLTTGYGMIAHGVGSGKTLTQIALAMEMRRLGKAKKPVIVVEKSTIGQFASAFRRAYPQAKLLVAGDRNFGADDRARFLGMMQSGDWDSIIMTRPQVTKIPHEDSAFDDYLARRLAALDAALVSASDPKTQNNIQGIRDALEEQIQKMRDKLRENQDLAGVTWERLGVDTIIVDEAHNFKNTFVYTQMENVKNLPTGTSSQQSISMELKTSNVRNRSNKKGVFFATGTPVSNAMHEAWVMMNYIAPHVLEENGVGTFDQFADTYGDTKTAPEANWNGEVKDVTRFAKFVNGKSLISLIRSVFDVAMGNAKLGLDVPQVKGGESSRMILDETPPMKRVNTWIVDSVAEQWKNTFGEKDENGAYIVRPMQGLRQYIDANPWVTAVPIMTMQAGIAAALDPRMLHTNAPDDPGSKVNRAVAMILDRYRDEENARNKTTQVVFTDLRRSFNTDFLEQFTGENPFGDLGNNTADFDLYEDIAKKLVAGGMKRSEIGWLPGEGEKAMNDDQKEAFFDKVNSGEIRVIIGGEGISTGVNIQGRLGTAYHLMPPRNFKPAQMEQRNGRIIRQGNLWAEWAHNAYVTAAERASGQKFEGNKPEKRRKAAAAWLKEHDKDGTMTAAAEKAAARYDIEIFELGMGKSLDSAIYSMMAAKQGFIAQVLSGQAGEEFEDPTDAIMLSMAEMAAQTIGDADLIRKIEAERELKELRVQRSAWIGKQSEHMGTIRTYTETLPRMRERLAKMQESSAFYEGLFDRRKDEEGKPQAPLYEFSTGTEFDPENKEQKKAVGGITNAMNAFFMETWANRKGSNAVVANGSVKINGVKFDVEIHEPLPGDDRGMPGEIVGLGGHMAFHGAQSFLATIRNAIADLPKVTEGMRQGVRQAEQRIERARKALDDLPKAFAGEQRFQMLTEEIRGLRERITSRKRGGGEEFINPEDLTRWESEGGNTPKARTFTAQTPNDLVVANIGMAHGIADRFDNIAGSDRDERRAIARQALVKAARGFDSGKGEFAAYAGTAVRNAMRDHFAKQGNYAHHEITTLDEPLPNDAEATRKDLVPSATSVTNDVQRDDLRQAIRDALSGLPEGLREVVEGIANGDTLEAIGQRQGGITKQGVARKAGIALDRMRQRLAQAGIRGVDDVMPAARGPVPLDNTGSFEDEVARIIRFARAEEPGQRTIGRPDLSLGALDPIVMGVDEWRKQYLQPETHRQWEDEAEKMLATDYEGTKRRIIEVATSGDQLRDAEVKAAMQIVAKEVQKAAAEPDNEALQKDVQMLVNSYRQARAEQARGLAAGRDPFKTPADRYREFLAKVIFQAPADVQKKLDDAQTPEERKQILTEDAKRIARIKAALDKMGITLDDLFSGEVDLRLKARKTAENELSAAKGKDADILKAFMERRNFAAVAFEMKVPEADVRRVVEAAKARVIARHAEKFKKGATAANVVKSQAPAVGWQSEMNSFLDAIGLTEETPAQAKKRAKRKAKGRPFDINDPVAVVRIARTIQAIDSGALNMAMELWMNNILSGPATHVANIAGNAVSMAWDLTVQRGAESMLNLAFRDKGAAQIGEAKYLLRGIMPGLARARQLAEMAWTAEYDFTEHVLLGKPVDLQEISGKVAGSTAIRGTVGRVVRIPGRALLYADSFFKGLIATMEVGAQAYRTAKGEGLSGDALERRIGEQVNTYGSPAWVAAVEKAKELTFQQTLRPWGGGEGETHNPFEAMATAVQKASISCPPLRFLVPFIRTPFNILRAGIRKTPLGTIPLAADVLGYATGTGRNWLARIIGNEVKPNPKLPADFVKRFAEQLIGWSIMGAIWGMAQGDDDDDTKPILITGSSPKREVKWGEKELQNRAYGGDYIIRVGGRNGSTFAYGRYEPFATVLGTVVDAARVLKRPSTGTDKLDAFFNYAVAQAEDKTFLRGIADMMQTISDGRGVGGKAANALAQALVPNIIRQPLRNLDDYVRDSRGAGPEYTALPLPENAQKKHDVYGGDVKKSGTPLARVLVTTPTQTAERLQPADEMMLRWNRQHPEETYAPQPPLRTYRDHATGKDVKMTDEQYAKYTALVGTKVKANLAGKVTPQMIAAPKADDIKIVKDAFEKARHEAREQMFARKVPILSPAY